MKFKLKINDKTTLDDIRNELEALKSANIKEIPLNHLRRIIKFLGANEVQSTGSSVRFEHSLLKQHPYYHGHFQIHKVHKGGNKDFVRKTDFKSYLCKVLITIIELIEKK